MTSLENKGTIIISKFHEEVDTLWFILNNLKNSEEDINDIHSYAKVWLSSKNYKCTFSSEINQKVKALAQNMYIRVLVLNYVGH